MRAVILKDFGGIENLATVEVPIPTIGEHEVLIKTKALSINPVDVKTRSGGALAQIMKAYQPLILGWDVSGVVAGVGQAVQDFKVGDEVFGMVNFVGHGQAYAEYVAAPSSHLALKPQNISHEEAAATTLAALTAWQAFTKNGQLKSKDKVLIHAAAGGVGHFAVQIAKHMGAYVIGTASADNKDFMMSLGVDHAIDYRTQNFAEVLQDIDFVLEAIGGENFERSVSVVKPAGTIINLPSGLTDAQKQLATDKGLQVCFFMAVESNGPDMKVLADLLEQQIIKPHISQVFNFDEIGQAHLQLETGRTVGKIVVRL